MSTGNMQLNFHCSFGKALIPMHSLVDNFHTTALDEEDQQALNMLLRSV